MAEATPVFPTLQMNTHMPFFDGNYLLFSGSENVVQKDIPNSGTIFRRMATDRRLREHFAGLSPTSRVAHRAWKLFYCTWKDRQPVRLSTGLPSEYIECSPAMYQDNGHTYVSFIGGALANRGFVYHLYIMDGESLSRLSNAVLAVPGATRIGFVSKKYICVSGSQGLAITERSTGKITYLRPSLPRIARVTFRAEDADTLVITGFDAAGAAKTLLYSLPAKKTQDVQATIPAYKSSVFGTEMVTARRVEAGVEPYRLFSAPFTVADSKETVLVVS